MPDRHADGCMLRIRTINEAGRTMRSVPLNVSASNGSSIFCHGYRRHGSECWLDSIPSDLAGYDLASYDWWM